MFTLKKGFSLMELLIVLAIIAILATLSYPHYNQHLITIHRATATVTLADVAARLEQYYSQNNSYSGATLAELGVSDASYKNYYQLFIAQATDDNYLIHAIPQGKQAQEDINCGTLSIDQNGNKHVTGSGTVAECWQ